jgi:hypothetical protein
MDRARLPGVRCVQDDPPDRPDLAENDSCHADNVVILRRPASALLRSYVSATAHPLTGPRELTPKVGKRPLNRTITSSGSQRAP